MTRSTEITLFKALMMLGFEKIGPRTLRKGNVKVSVKIDYEVTWEIETQTTRELLSNQRDLVRRLYELKVIDDYDLDYLALLGLDFRKHIEESKFSRIAIAFINQVVLPELQKILRQNNMRCPVCDKRLISLSSFYNHLSYYHRDYLERLASEIVGNTP